MSRRIAVVPAYNEETTVEVVLTALRPLVDELIVVDDGSTDATRARIERWLDGRDGARLLVHERNRGMSAAYHTAFSDLRLRMEFGELDAGDLVFTLDADGQHDPAELERLEEILLRRELDAVLGQRDLSAYPAYKRWGNAVMSAWASWWAGAPLPDVESGFRVFRLGALADALHYYKGFRYSETVEVAVVLCRLGYRVDNAVPVSVPVFRSRTRISDALIDLAMIPAARARVRRLGTARRPGVAGAGRVAPAEDGGPTGP